MAMPSAALRRAGAEVVVAEATAPREVRTLMATDWMWAQACELLLEGEHHLALGCGFADLVLNLGFDLVVIERRGFGLWPHLLISGGSGLLLRGLHLLNIGGISLADGGHDGLLAVEDAADETLGPIPDHAPQSRRPETPRHPCWHPTSAAARHGRWGAARTDATGHGAAAACAPAGAPSARRPECARCESAQSTVQQHNDRWLRYLGGPRSMATPSAWRWRLPPCARPARPI